HKGVVRWHVTTSGRACHSSCPENGVNAIYRMANLLVGIERYVEFLKSSIAPDPMLGRPTISVGLIDGGTSANTVPDRCHIEIDRRLLPGEDPRGAPRHFVQFLKQNAGIDFEFECADPWMSKTGLSPAGSEELVARLGRAIDSVRGSHQVVGVPYGTD